MKLQHLLVLATLVTSACITEPDELASASAGDGDGNFHGDVVPAEHVDGKLLAELVVSRRHRILLYELSAGGIAVQELAHEDEPTLLQNWDGHGSVLEHLRDTLPGSDLPLAIIETERAELAVSTRDKPRGQRPPPAPRAADLDAIETAPSLPLVTPTTSHADATSSSPQPPDGLRFGFDWDADAAAWSAAYCQSSPDGWGNAVSWFDGIWCPTNWGTAISGSRPTSDFEARGMNASFTVGATHWLERWTGSVWQRIATNPVPPRYHSLWLLRANDIYRSGIEGDRIHFSVRYRRQMPVMTQLADFPSDFSGWDYGLTEDMQGVANDGSNWYMTNEDQIAKWPVSTPLVFDPSLHFGMPAAWTSTFNHMGDLVHAKGRLYVPLEGNNRAIGVFNPDLTYVGYAVIDQAHAAWLAYNPKDGLFYSSASFDSVSTLTRWQVTVSGSTVTAVPKGTVSLVGNAVPIKRIQGGEFSAKGNLYVTSDVTGGGVFAIDVLTGFVAAKGPLTFSPGGVEAEELEGLTIWDLDSNQSLGVAGQIHVLMVDNDWPSSDDLYFKHMRVNPLSDL